VENFREIVADERNKSLKFKKSQRADSLLRAARD